MAISAALKHSTRSLLCQTFGCCDVSGTNSVPTMLLVSSGRVITSLNRLSKPVLVRCRTTTE